MKQPIIRLIIFLNMSLDSKATAPSIYFIGKGGATLEIVTEPSNSKDFLNKITEILKKGDIVPQSTNVPGKYSIFAHKNKMPLVQAQ